jgi:transposase
VPDERTRSIRDERDDLIQRQRDEITRLREEVARAEQQRRKVERDRDRLKRQNERLKQQLDAARRAGFRQAAPFAKDRPQGHGGRPGRRAGAAYGRRERRPIPSRVDETYTAPLPPECPRCGGAIHLTRVAPQYQEDLPIVRPIVRRFDVQVGCCVACGQRVQGRHPLQTSDALGAAGVHLGPGAVTLVVLLHTHFGVPLEKIATVVRERFGLTVTAGGLVHALHRAARAAAPTYAALCEQVRGSPIVSPDETGWRVGAVLHWLWAFATPDTTVYAIRPGRSFDDAVAILGTAFDGVLVRDGWAPYRQFTDALHQTCLAHLLRRCRTLCADHPRSPWAADVQQVLLDALALRDRRDAHAISDHGLAVARGHLLSRLARLIDTAPALPAATRFAAHLAVEFPAVFAFLWDARIDATNWRAEHAIRPAVVARKVCGGNRTPHGADTQQVLASVVRTARQRRLDLNDLFATLLRAPGPVVPATFRPALQ